MSDTQTKIIISGITTLGTLAIPALIILRLEPADLAAIILRGMAMLLLLPVIAVIIMIVRSIHRGRPAHNARQLPPPTIIVVMQAERKAELVRR